MAVFVTQNKVVDYKVIENADQLKIMAEEYIGALNTVDASVYQKSHKLFLKLIEPFLKETTKKILISPHSFLNNLPFEGLAISKELGDMRSFSFDGKKSRIFRDCQKVIQPRDIVFSRNELRSGALNSDSKAKCLKTPRKLYIFWSGGTRF